jgi:hypothetical protein
MPTADVPIPDLATLNPAELWLVYFRQLHDTGVAITAARQIADARFGPSCA